MVEKLEIVGGLKNALERGGSLDEAKQSFINAGYSPRDVEDSSRALNSGVLFLSVSPRSQSHVSPYKPLENPVVKEETQKDRKGLALVIFLALILVLLVGVLLASVFAKDKILEILKSIGILS